MKLGRNSELVLLAEKLLVDDGFGWVDLGNLWKHSASGMLIGFDGLEPVALQYLPLGFFARRRLRIAIRTCIYKRCLDNAVKEQEKCLKAMEPPPPSPPTHPRASLRKTARKRAPSAPSKE